jgi:Fe-S cluster assembly ATP-binding protein
MLVIDSLTVKVEGKVILENFSMTLEAGKIEALMGPNGSGKSTLASTLAGAPHYEVLSGTAKLDGIDLLSIEPHQRAQAGIFLAFQYPVEIPGISFLSFLKEVVNAKRKAQGLPPKDAGQFLIDVKEKLSYVGLEESFLYRSVNEGFSGGEKKRAEILQMLLLEPKIVILDETDSGLDIDALRLIATCVRKYQSDRCAVLVITHYQRLLDYMHPDRVHIFSGGKIIQSGDLKLAQKLEQDGYAQFLA